MKTIFELFVQMALENPSWGYIRIRGALANLGHQIARGTIANILKENGIEPAPSTFLKAHWASLTATDFLSVEVCTIKGLVTHYVLFVVADTEATSNVRRGVLLGGPPSVGRSISESNFCGAQVFVARQRGLLIG